MSSKFRCWCSPLTFAFCFLAIAPNLFAQTSANGSLRGSVRNQQIGALEGATVTAASPAVPMPVSSTTDANGRYRLLELPPGEYTVTVELKGFARAVRPGVVVRAGLNLDVNVELMVGAEAESITVQGDAPMIERQTAVQAFNFAGDFQRKTPLSYSNHWSNFLAMTPGVVGSQVTGRTADSYTLRGSYFGSHVIQIDGADMASAQQNSTLYVNLSSEAIADVQVKTGAVDASSPIGVGAVMNVATKSGTNELRGVGSFSLQRKSWSANNNPGGVVAALNTFLPEAALGGPLVRDRAWAFGAYRYEHVESGIARTAGQVATLKALDPTFEPFDSVISGQYLLAKITAQPTAAHHAEFSYTYDPQQTKSGEAYEAQQFIHLETGGNRSFGFRLSSAWNSRLATRVGVSYNNRAVQTTATDLPDRRVTARVIPSAGRLADTGLIADLDNGNGGVGARQPFSKSTVFADLVYFQPGWFGAHEFQSGVYLQPRNHEETLFLYANGGFNLEGNVLRDANDPSKGIVPYWRQVFDADHSTFLLSNTRDVAVYVQDAWQPNDRLTVNAGLRVDFVKRVDKIFDVVIQDSANVGPRFGINYAATADRLNVVRAAWGRVHDVVSTNAVTAGTNNIGKRDFYDLDLDGIFDTQFVTPATTALATNRIIDRDRRQPFIDEWMIGYRRQFPSRLTVDASVVRREYKNRTAFVDQNGIFENGVFRGYRDERFNEIYQVTGNQWNRQVYSGLELQVVKDTAALRLIGSYTRAWRHIAGTWQPNDPASFIQPNAFPNDKGIGGVRASSSSAADANGLSGTQMTFDNGGWQDHVARAGAIYYAPWQILIAANYVFQSGAFTGPIVTRVAAPDPQFGPPTVTLSNGRVVSNPLATTIRFAGATRGDGQLRLPALHIWNLRIGREMPLGANRRVELAAEVFNVTNSDADQSFQSGANQLYSPNYSKTGSRQLPRSLRVSARVAF